MIIFVLLALLAEVLGTVGGFGSSLFFVPIAGYFFDFHSVLGITALFHLSSNITKIALFRQGIDKQLILYMGIPAIVTVAIGAWVSRYANSHFLELALAVFLTLFSSLLLLFRSYSISPRPSNAVRGGLVSGFVAGLLGTGGAIRGIVLSAFQLKMQVFIATSAVIDLGIDFSRSVVYGLNGYIHSSDLYLIPPLFGASLAGTYIGKRILTRVSEDGFRSIVLVLILGVGLFTLIRYLY